MDYSNLTYLNADFGNSLVRKNATTAQAIKTSYSTAHACPPGERMKDQNQGLTIIKSLKGSTGRNQGSMMCATGYEKRYHYREKMRSRQSLVTSPPFLVFSTN